MTLPARKPNRSAAAALAAIAIILVACRDDRPERWQQSLQAAERADAPAAALSQCMIKSLNPKAAFEIGSLEIREGREMMAGVPTYQVRHGPLTPFPKSSDQLVEEVAESLAVHCGAPRDDWKSKPFGVAVDSHAELSSERGIALMSMAFANDRFVKHLKSSDAFMDGVRVERDRKSAANAVAAARAASAVAAQLQEAHDFAVRE